LASGAGAERHGAVDRPLRSEILSPSPSCGREDRACRAAPSEAICSARMAPTPAWRRGLLVVAAGVAALFSAGALASSIPPLMARFDDQGQQDVAHSFARLLKEPLESSVAPSLLGGACRRLLTGSWSLEPVALMLLSAAAWKVLGPERSVIYGMCGLALTSALSYVSSEGVGACCHGLAVSSQWLTMLGYAGLRMPSVSALRWHLAQRPTEHVERLCRLLVEVRDHLASEVDEPESPRATDLSPMSRFSDLYESEVPREQSWRSSDGDTPLSTPSSQQLPRRNSALFDAFVHPITLRKRPSSASLDASPSFGIEKRPSAASVATRSP